MAIKRKVTTVPADGADGDFNAQDASAQ